MHPVCLEPDAEEPAEPEEELLPAEPATGAAGPEIGMTHLVGMSDLPFESRAVGERPRAGPAGANQFGVIAPPDRAADQTLVERVFWTSGGGHDDDEFGYPGEVF